MRSTRRGIRIRLIRGLQVSGMLASFGIAGEAWAFCRTTTADQVEADADGCAQNGIPLEWVDHCIPIGLQQDGSPSFGITYEQARTALLSAMGAWEGVTCDGKQLSLQWQDRGKMECDQVQFELEAKMSNNNIVLFREDWPYTETQNTTALTTITYELATGEILDADIEVNPAALGEDVRTELQAVFLHELGHLLGLAHSREEGAVMTAQYKELEIWQLSADDQLAVCAALGTDDLSCKAEEAGVDYTRECAEPTELESGIECSLRAMGSRAPSSGIWFPLLALGWAWQRRRSGLQKQKGPSH